MWHHCKFGDIISIKKGKAITRKDATEGLYPVILGGKTPAYYINQYNRYGKTIVISRSGASAGYVSFWKEPIFVTDGFIIDPTKNIDHDFLYYLLKSKQSELSHSQRGSAIPHVTPSLIRNIAIKIPSLVSQQKIVSILTNYDDSIELNNRRIAILEEMAMRTYREWFSVFRFPGHETTEFVDGLPKGWKYRSVTDILQIFYGKDHKLVYDGLFPIYGSGGIMRYGNEYLYEGESVLIPRKGTLNNIILADGKFWCIDTMFYSIPKIPKICKLAFFQLKAFDMEVFNSGTALPSMTIKILSCLKLLVPDEKYRTLFEQSISAIFNEVTNLKKLNATLQQMRDRLLPQLMSGKIEVTP